MEEEYKEPEESNRVSDAGIIKFLTVAFVLAMYLVIFMKILFIK